MGDFPKLQSSGMLVANLSSINQFEPQSGDMVSCTIYAPGMRFILEGLIQKLKTFDFKNLCIYLCKKIK
jgi:hypothetical protein